jgi:DNA-binding transcriptional regulator WhiA|tara:strand:+ start:571 stop:837 length:267 start_codon:yes stop_codon:yes gene_type:complete
MEGKKDRLVFGKVSKEVQKEFKRMEMESKGIEELLGKLVRRQGKVAIENKALWIKIFTTLNITDPGLVVEIDKDTLEVFIPRKKVVQL